MTHPVHLRLVERIKSPQTGDPIRDIAWRVGGVIIFPIVLILGLLLMAMLSIYALVANLFAGDGHRPTREAATTDGNTVHEWTEFAAQKGLKLFSTHLGEVRFGPEYIALSSDPVLIGLEGKIFGYWVYHAPNAIMLHQWNSTSIPDTNLVIIDPELRTLSTSLQRIPSVQWTMRKLDDEGFELVCVTAKETLTYHVQLGQ